MCRLRHSVAAPCPSLWPRIPDVKVIQAPQVAQIADGDKKVIAEVMLELSDHVNKLQHQMADLMARVEYLEANALAKVAAA